MLLKHARTGHLVEVADVTTLTNPFKEKVDGQFLWGEETQDPEPFTKQDLVFPSDEQLPQCWWDTHFQDEGLVRHQPTANERTPGYYGA